MHSHSEQIIYGLRGVADQIQRYKLAEEPEVLRPLADLILGEFDYFQQRSKQIQSVISYFLSKMTFSEAFTIFNISYNSNLYLVKLVSLTCQGSSLGAFFDTIVND